MSDHTDTDTGTGTVSGIRLDIARHWLACGESTDTIIRLLHIPADTVDMLTAEE